MHHIILPILGLLFAVFLLVMLAQRIRVAYPIFLVVAGWAISFVPGMPVLHLDPEIIFLIFLPPLLYEAAWYTSGHDFWKWKRPHCFAGVWSGISYVLENKMVIYRYNQTSASLLQSNYFIFYSMIFPHCVTIDAL